MRSPSIAKLLPKTRDVLFIIIFISVLLLGNRMLNIDGDLPRHLVTGKYILQIKQLPSTEPFAYPYQNREFVSQQWLAGVILYLIYSFAGLSGIVILSAILLASTFTYLYAALVQKLDLRLSIFLLLLWGGLTTSLSWITRPHLFSMLFLAIFLIWADKLRRGKNISIWRFPILMLIWTNIHGEFISGILVLLAYAVGAIIDNIFNERKVQWNSIGKIWLTLLLSLAATVINPGGLERWSGMVGFMNNQYMMSRMLETHPPDFQTPELRILLLLLAASIFLLGFKKERLSAGQGLLLAGFTAMSLIAFRNIHLYGIVAPFVLAETLVDFKEIRVFNNIENNIKNVESKITAGFVLPAIVLIALTVYIYTSNIGSSIYKFNSENFPVNAVTWLKSHPQQGHMFNDLNWGGYISFRLWPEQQTFIDSVADITGELTMQYERVITLQPGWNNILEQYKIQWAIIPARTPLTNELIKTGWTILYQDETAVVLHTPIE